MEQPKKPMGRPPTPPEKHLLQRSVRLSAEQWEKIDSRGGVKWLRKVIDASKLPKLPD